VLFRLPELRKRTSDSLTEARNQEKKLPPPPSLYPVSELFDLVVNFSNGLQRHVDASEGHEDLIRDCRENYLAFKRAIAQTSPNFIPYTKAELESKSYPPSTNLTINGETIRWRLSYDDQDDHIESDEYFGFTMNIDDVRDHVSRCAILVFNLVTLF
jgi:hypothetical protein